MVRFQFFLPGYIYFTWIALKKVLYNLFNDQWRHSAGLELQWQQIEKNTN